MLLWLLWSVDLVSDMRALNFLQQGQKGLTWNFEFLILDVELFTSLRCLYYCRKNSDELFAVLDRRAKESDKIRGTSHFLRKGMAPPLRLQGSKQSTGRQHINILCLLAGIFETVNL